MVDYYSVVKKNEIMPSAATWRHLEIIILSEVRRDKYHMISLICGISDMAQLNLPMKQKQIHKHRGCQGKGVRGGMEWEVAVSRCYHI